MEERKTGGETEKTTYIITSCRGRDVATATRALRPGLGWGYGGNDDDMNLQCTKDGQYNKIKCCVMFTLPIGIYDQSHSSH